MKPLILIAAGLQEIRLLARILEKRFDIAVALDGEKTIFAARQRKPDVILLDERLRLADGGAVCPVLRYDHPETQEIPVLFLLDSGAYRGRAREEGAVDYLHKPFEAEEVLSRVQTFASLNRSGHSPGKPGSALPDGGADRSSASRKMGWPGVSPGIARR
ncbi:MAG: response regulator [Magnetococcales bacterium]|nr:response regulator [Magnetococcales bacterium]